MKKIITLCLLTVLGFTAVYAQNKAVIEIKKKVHDFGNIKESAGEARCTFEIENKGNAPLVINNVTASCGCTTPEWTKAPIAPGRKGTIKVGFNPAGRPGPFDKTITVHSNATEANIVLRIKGNVEQKVLTIEEQYPEVIGGLRLKNKVLSMERINNTSSRTETMEVYNNGTTPVIISFEKVPAHIKMEASPVSLGAKQKGTIKCTYMAAQKKEFGPVNDVITVKANNTKGSITVQANIEEDISKLSAADFEKAPTAVVRSSSADIGTIKKGQPASATYEITNNGKSDLLIRKVTADCNCIQATANPQTVKPGQKTTITAKLDSKNESGEKFYNITVTTNAPRQQSVNLFMVGAVN